MEEYVKCDLCNSDNFEIVYEKSKAKHKVDLKDKYSAAKGVPCTDQVVKCKKCGLVYINPRTKEDVIIESCSEGDDEVYASQGESRMETFKSGLKWLEKFTPKKGRLLDVGCAAGFFLKVAKDNGWNVKGVEPNKWLAEQGRKNFKLDVFSGVLEEAKFNDKEFDVVTMWDVIEHIPKPKGALIETNRAMKENGILLLGTPDFSSVFAKMFGRRWWFLLSHHLYYFTPETLRRMLEETGFKIVKKKLHWQTLELGYLVNMFKHLSNNKVTDTISDSALKIMAMLHMNKIKIPYYASQVDFIAKKVRDV